MTMVKRLGFQILGEIPNPLVTEPVLAVTDKISKFLIDILTF